MIDPLRAACRLLHRVRVANVPLAPGMEPPSQLFELDPRRVFGLVTDPKVLVDIRCERMREIGMLVPRYAEREDCLLYTSDAADE